jgi:type II secretory pathway component GspD/PulD (secretin)
MKSCFAIFSLFFCLACWAATAPKADVSEHDQKLAEKEFKNALEFQKKGKAEDALLAATRATQLAPDNMEYRLAAETLRQQVVGTHVEEGNRLADIGDMPGAAKQFQIALGLDPQNAFATQRLHDVSPPDPDPEHRHVLQLLASVDQINLRPAAGKKSFHSQADTRQLYTAIATAFGISVQFDQGVNARMVRFDLDNVDFYTAMNLLGKMTKTFWAPVSSSEAIVANDTQELRRQYERMALRTFYVSNAAAQTDLNDLVNVMRTIFDMRFVSIQPSKNTITVRAPREQVEAASSLIDNLMDAKPELVIDVKEFEIDTDKTRNLGMNLPTDFQVFNIPSEIRRVLGSDAQAVIDQLNKTGTIDPSKIPASSLSNLAGSPLLSPFIFFGKGLFGLTGITVPSISAKAQLSKSESSTLEHVTLRATDGEAATFQVGTKFPIVNSTFTNVAVSTQGQVQIGNTPQFTYVDLGITLKTTPHYHSNGDVTLAMDLAIQGLGTQQFNSIPDITTRGYKGTITVGDGEPSVIMGAITEQELRSISGLPLLSQIPGAQALLSNYSKEHLHNEVLIVITPHVVRKPFRDKGSGVFWNITP